MSHDWQRQRDPADVPTPVAVGLSDFCRRAQAPASPADVREALSALAERDDARMQGLTDADPPATPLGPFAAVDIVLGIDPALAARRQEVGYYALARALLADSPRPGGTGGAPSTAPGAPPGPPTAQVPAPPARSPEPAPAPPTLAERIAPRRRLPGSGPPAAETRPRGRFTQLPTERMPVEALFEPEAAERLSAMLTAHGQRPALLRALATQSAGRRGPELSAEDLDAALAQHGLLARAEAQERLLVLGGLEEHRGALGRVSWGLGVRPAELAAWISRLGLGTQVEQIREGFRREALSPSHWTARLDLLGRRKYLADLGIVGLFEETLRRDLREALGVSEIGPDAPIDRLSRRLGVSAELLARSLDKLGLA